MSEDGGLARPLAALFREQGKAGVGVPVLLFTDRALARTVPGADVDAAARVVATAAERVGLDPGGVDLFSPGAYVLQNALVAAVAPDPVLAGPTAPGDGSAVVRSRPGPAGDPWTPAHSAALLDAPVLALNFHTVPHEHRATVRRQLEQLAAFGPSLDLERAPREAECGPQVLVAFYDGFRDEGMWGAQVCAELGLRAWFFPVFSHRTADGAPRSVELLTRDDLAQIARVHAVGFHTASHRRAAELGPADLRREVFDPLDAITAATGRPVTAGAWRGGTRFDPANPADRALRERGVGHLVSNWSIETIPPAG